MKKAGCVNIRPKFRGSHREAGEGAARLITFELFGFGVNRSQHFSQGR